MVPDQVPAFEKDLLEYFNGSAKDVRDELEQKLKLDDDLNAKLDNAFKQFKAGWSAG